MKPDAPDSRRGFLAKVAAVACGGLATLAPVAAGVWAFLDPLRRKVAAATFLPVTELSAIPDDGVPRQFAVIADRVDAWTGFPREPIGAVTETAAEIVGRNAVGTSISLPSSSVAVS